MHERNSFPRPKSFTSILDILGPHYKDVEKDTKKDKTKKRNRSHHHPTGGDAAVENSNVIYSNMIGKNPFVTVEQFHVTHRDPSFKADAKSTSTIFYDLDELAKRHSFNCFEEVKSKDTDKEFEKWPRDKKYSHKSDCFVQECTTSSRPHLLYKDSIVSNRKKLKKNLLKTPSSSEIRLRDEEVIVKKHKKGHRSAKKSLRHQNIWSYATGFEHVKIQKKPKKPEPTDNQSEDPCPCQLFSYACPCHAEKSLTGLSKNNKTITTIDQNTSVMKQISENKVVNRVLEDKLTCTSNAEQCKQCKQTHSIGVAPSNNASNRCEDKDYYRKRPQNCPDKSHYKTPRCLICPKCNEKLDILSVTEEEFELSRDSHRAYRARKVISTTCPYQEHLERENDSVNDSLCPHYPRCEMVPVCQLLRAERQNSKPLRRRAKTGPRILRVTKACRHHPPCVVVPSCQRANVLKNNCAYIPPCVHKPRCINLPLCAPFSKLLGYEQRNRSENSEDSFEMKPGKFSPTFINESDEGNVNEQVNIMHSCKLRNTQHSPACPLEPKLSTCYERKPSPFECCCCNSTKSCQYECHDCQCADDPSNLSKPSSSEAVVFIRDVGCQFKDIYCTPAASGFQVDNSKKNFMKTGTFNNNHSMVHTLIYEDKFTNPISQNPSRSLSKSFSYEQIRQYYSPRNQEGQRQEYRDSSRVYKSQMDPILAAYMTASYADNYVTPEAYAYRVECENAFPLKMKSRKNALKHKYRKMFSVKRHKKYPSFNQFARRDTPCQQ